MANIQEYRTPLFENAQVMALDQIPKYEVEDYDLFDEKQFKKYIDDVERLVRSSKEYRDFVQYLRKYMDMNSSLYFENVNNIDTTKIKIELHHMPFTLFDIALTVFNKRNRCKEPLDVLLVAKEVCYIHYFLYIGLVPLSKTEHKLVHTQSLTVPLDAVLGRYDKFIEMYEQDIPVEAMERYNVYKDMSEHYKLEEASKVLEVTPTYLKLESNENGLGAYTNPYLQNVLNATQNRLYQLTNKSYQAQPIETNKIKPFTYDHDKMI